MNFGAGHTLHLIGFVEYERKLLQLITRESTCPRWARLLPHLASLTHFIHQSMCPRWARFHDLREVRLVRPLSIHMPAMGTTLHPLRSAPGCFFQSTCPRWARQEMAQRMFAESLFQSTCPRRARLLRRCYDLKQQQFQSTCPRRARPKNSRAWPQVNYFNPRAREGHDLTILSR